MSVSAATWLVRDVINLRDRHPMLWASVLQGHVPAYRAFQLTQLAARYHLSRAQAHASTSASRASTAVSVGPG